MNNEEYKIPLIPLVVCFLLPIFVLNGLFDVAVAWFPVFALSLLIQIQKETKRNLNLKIKDALNKL